METAKTLRLLLFSKCNRSCEGCCNKDWDLKNLPVVTTFHGYKKIILTGGEPMLDPILVINTIAEIRKTSGAPIIMYTAKTKRYLDLIAVLQYLDGLTLTLHEPYDVKPFVELNDLLQKLDANYNLHPKPYVTKSLRLNVFAGIDLTGVDTSLWQVKNNIEWIENCPLPEDEVFMKLA